MARSAPISDENGIMSISIVQSFFTDGGAESPYSITLGSPITEGNLLIVCSLCDGTSIPDAVITDDSGSGQVWNHACGILSTSGNGVGDIFYCYNAAGGTYSVTVTADSGNVQGAALIEAAGILGSSNPLDQTAVITTVFNTAPSTPPVTTTSDGELIFCYYDDGFAGVGPGVGFTTIGSGPNDYTLGEYLVQTTAGSIAGSATGGGGYAILLMATFFAASAPVSPENVLFFDTGF